MRVIYWFFCLECLTVLRRPNQLGPDCGTIYAELIFRKTWRADRIRFATATDAFLKPRTKDYDMSSMLIVDDDRSVRHLIQAAMRDSNFTIFNAATAQDGLTLLKNESPDVILLDIMLPDMSGLEAFHKIHELAPPHAGDLHHLGRGQ